MLCFLMAAMVLNITDGKKNAKIPKDKEPAALILEECVELLATATPGKRGQTQISRQQTAQS